MCLNCCLYSRDGKVSFLEGARELGGIVEAFEPADLARARAVAAALHPDGRPAEVVRDARRPESVLGSAGAPAVIDYWSLDTEGSEWEILRYFPFETYRVRVLTVEHNFGSTRDPVRALLESRGYERIADLGIDDGYVLRDDPAILPPGGR